MTENSPFNSDEERELFGMLGVRSAEDLLAAVPPRLRETAGLALASPGFLPPAPLSADAIHSRLFPPETASISVSFLGGGCYFPPPLPEMRSLETWPEILFASDCAVAELAQGTMTLLHELQTGLAALTGLDTATCTVPDPGLALALVLLSIRERAGGARPVIVAESAPWAAARRGLGMLRHHPPAPVPLRWDASGRVDHGELAAIARVANPAAVVVGHPNAFGVFESLPELRALLPPDCLVVTLCADPLSLAGAPTQSGVDLTIGDLQPLGSPPARGGETAGFVCCLRDLSDLLPGWMVAREARADGPFHAAWWPPAARPGDRDAVLRPSVVRAMLAWQILGEAGMRDLARRAFERRETATRELAAVGIPPCFPTAPHGREAAFRVPNLTQRVRHALECGVAPGVPLGPAYGSHADLAGTLLVCFDADHEPADIERLVDGVSRG